MRQQCHSAVDTMQQVASLQEHLENQRYSLEKLFYEQRTSSYPTVENLDPIVAIPNILLLQYVMLLCMCLCVCVVVCCRTFFWQKRKLLPGVPFKGKGNKNA